MSLLLDTVSHCHIHIMCSTCTNSTNCHWLDNKCQYIDPTLNTTSSSTAAAATGSLVCPALVDDYCSYSSCVSCVAHKDCGWSMNGCRKKSNGEYYENVQVIEFIPLSLSQLHLIVVQCLVVVQHTVLAHLVRLMAVSGVLH